MIRRTVFLLLVGAVFLAVEAGPQATLARAEHASGGPGVASAGKARVRITVAAIAFGRDLRASGAITGVRAKPRPKWRLRVLQRLRGRWVTRVHVRLSRALTRGRYAVRWRSAKPRRTTASTAAAGPKIRVMVTSPAGPVGSAATRAQAAPSVPAPSSCSEARLLGVRGSGETKSSHGGYGSTIKSVVDWLRALEPGAVSSPVDYPAIGVNAIDPRYFAHRYQDSVEAGIAALVSNASSIMRACPGRSLYLAGYSQGAQVVGDAYLDWLTPQERSRITRIVLIGDPKFVGGQAGSVNAGDYNPKLNGVVTLGAGRSRHLWATSDGTKVRSYCANGDPVCNFSSLGQAAGCKATSGSCPHMHYMGLDFPGTTAAYTQAAAQFLSGRTQPPKPTQTLKGYAEFPLPADTFPLAMTVGPDKNLWLTAGSDRFARVLRITTGGAVSVFPFPQPAGGNGFRGISAGPDGNLWATAWAGTIAQIAPDGSLRDFALPDAGSGPGGIVAGPDGNLWFTEVHTGKIGRITTSGAITEFTLPLAPGTFSHTPGEIAAGSDGNLWFTDQVSGRNPGGFGPYIGRITPQGDVTEYPLADTNKTLGRITPGPDGNLWFTETDGTQQNGAVGRITPQGLITEYALQGSPRAPFDITPGPDGNLWVAEVHTHRIVRVTPSGQITDYALASDRRYPSTLVHGPDGNLWFTVQRPGGYAIARFSP